VSPLARWVTRMVIQIPLSLAEIHPACRFEWRTRCTAGGPLATQAVQSTYPSILYLPEYTTYSYLCQAAERDHVMWPLSGSFILHHAGAVRLTYSPATALYAIALSPAPDGPSWLTMATKSSPPQAISTLPIHRSGSAALFPCVNRWVSY
jgi:hypothetical protein